ncbi:MAG: metallophosphoesterase [Spirochaetia bacterium]|nr:metallophosphoesterase [Spirochaetia bacterium]
MDSSLLLCSDIHGSFSALELLLARAEEHQAQAIVIAGDLCPSEDLRMSILLKNASKVILVRGNCDNSYAFSQAQLTYPPIIQTLAWEGRTVLITHGDRFPSSYSLPLKKGDVFVSGHTHQPKIQMNEEGILHINPGSAAFPRTPLGPTYAVLESTQVSIRSLEDAQAIPAYQYFFPLRSDQ